MSELEYQEELRVAALLAEVDSDDDDDDDEETTDDERRRVFQTEWDYTRHFTAY